MIRGPLIVGCLILLSFIQGCTLFRVIGKPYPQPLVREEPPINSRALSREARELGRGLRIYPLQTGVTEVSYGQFFRGNEGWTGFSGIWNAGWDRQRFWAPVLAFLIEHPDEGLILVDAGLRLSQTKEDYYRPRLDGNARLYEDSINVLDGSSTIPAQLRRLGFEITDVRHLIITHWHEDHVGELNTFPHATVHLSEHEWNDRRRFAYRPSHEWVETWSTIDFDSGKLGSFDASEDLFEDGSIIMLPAFGHSFGHLAVYVNQGDYGAVVTGDALYSLRHLSPESLTATNFISAEAQETQSDSIRRIRSLKDTLGEVILLTQHDPFAYTAEYIIPYLADGVLTERERRAMLSYQESLYTPEGLLREEARPYHIDPSEGEAVGSISSRIR